MRKETGFICCALLLNITVSAALSDSSANDPIRAAYLPLSGHSPKTSDYWQGDEKKFTESFKDGKVFIGPLELDESTKSYSVQVSVPVRDAGKTIGVLVIGLRNVE